MFFYFRAGRVISAHSKRALAARTALAAAGVPVSSSANPIPEAWQLRPEHETKSLSQALEWVAGHDDPAGAAEALKAAVDDFYSDG